MLLQGYIWRSARLFCNCFLTDFHIMTRKNNIYQKTILGTRKMSEMSESETDHSKSNPSFMVVGLGNCEMLNTRHSVGMRVVNRLANRLDVQLNKDVFKHTGGYTACVDIGSAAQLILLKPRVPMNINGTSVAKTANFYKVPPENIFLIHDDLDIPVGNLQVKKGGSARGHNGVKSCVNSLQTDVMTRFLIGIDRPTNKDEVVEYVLGEFSSEEYKTVSQVINECLATLVQKIEETTGVELNLIAERERDYEHDIRYTRQDRHNRYDRPKNKRYVKAPTLLRSLQHSRTE